MKLWAHKQITRPQEGKPEGRQRPAKLDDGGPGIFTAMAGAFGLDDATRSSRCRRIRRGLTGGLRRRLTPEAAWVQRHVAHCPRCQKRLAALGQVDLALSFIKSQPHRLDLLTRANEAAVRMLNHSLRQAAQAKELEQARPEVRFLEWCGRYRTALTNVAACLAILFLTKAGIFSSFDKAQTRGEAALKHYYAAQAGEDVAREIFGA
jgi:hypothetical protein